MITDRRFDFGRSGLGGPRGPFGRGGGLVEGPQQGGIGPGNRAGEPRGAREASVEPQGPPRRNPPAFTAPGPAGAFAKSTV